MNTASRDRVNGFYCAAVVLVAIAFTRPLGESGVNDDWSYTKTALDLAQSGQLRYNGWAAAMIGAQAYWGATFIKLFGFSFLATRLSTVPLAAGCALLLYALHRRAQLSAHLSVFGTLTITLSPLFIPCAVSFMTEIPSFFLFLASLYSFARAAEILRDQPRHLESRRRFVLWLLSAIISGLLAGTVRQAFWILPVLAPLYLIFLQTGQGRLALSILLVSLSLISLLTGTALIAWFYDQPYAIHERVAVAISSLLHHETPLYFITQLSNIWLTLGALLLPVLIALSGIYGKIMKRHRSPALFGILCVALGILLTIWRIYFDSHFWIPPWLPNTFSITPYLNGTTPIPASAVSLTFPWQFWKGFSLLVIVLAFTAAAVAIVKSAWPPWIRIRPIEAIRNASFPLALFGLFAAGYLPLLLLKSLVPGGAGLFDRYLLPLTPIVSMVGLRIYFESTGRPRPPLLGWLALILAAYYGTAQTHDYFSLLRARLKLTTALEARGIPRTKIMGGFEYDGWTQITEAGYYNDPRIEKPKIGYIPPSPLSFETQYFFWQCTPVVRADYIVSLAEHPDLISTDLPSAKYRAWLPPFKRQCLVQTTNASLVSVLSLPLHSPH